MTTRAFDRPAAQAGVAILVVISASHFVVDASTSLLTPLLPAIRETYGVSIARTAALVAVQSFLSSMIQPLAGMLADRVDRRWLAALGPALCALGMTTMGYAPTFGMLTLLVAIGSIGSAIFHPA